MVRIVFARIIPPDRELLSDRREGRRSMGRPLGGGAKSLRVEMALFIPRRSPIVTCRSGLVVALALALV